MNLKAPGGLNRTGLFPNATGLSAQRKADRDRQVELGLGHARRKRWQHKIRFLPLNRFGIVAASIGMLLFLPQIVKQLGLTRYGCASPIRRRAGGIEQNRAKASFGQVKEAHDACYFPATDRENRYFPSRNHVCIRYYSPCKGY
jgi:hypothetical protein